MAIIDIKTNPSVRELQVFALLWLLFFLILGRVVFANDRLIVGAASFTSVMFLISFALNRDFGKRMQLWGLLIPGLLWGMHFSVWLAGEGTRAQWALFTCLIVVGVVGALLCLLSQAAARALYRSWMFAALPIGWTTSHLILAVVYYLLLTPIGLLRRTLGRDPMTRRLTPAAPSYWLSHSQQADSSRYFRQF